MGLQYLEIVLSIEETFGVSLYDTLFEPPRERMYDRDPPDISVRELFDLLLDEAPRNGIKLPADSWLTFRRILAEKLDLPEETILPDRLLVRDLGAG